MELRTTQRGFEIANFEDSYKLPCSIQKSSKADDDYIWLGIDKTMLTVFKDENKGQHIVTELPANWSVDTRMHLSREQVEQLLPLLQKFVETGDLS